MAPAESGFLDVGDGQHLFYSLYGAPDGLPVVILHGGPGSGLSQSIRNCFDPTRWRIIQFDQRGTGKSLPHAAADGADLSINTTQHLISDMEMLRQHLGIEHWTVAGGSWGATLAQAYIACHRSQVEAALLYLVTTTSRREIDWIAGGVGRFFPDAFARFCAGAPDATTPFERIAQYHACLMSHDPKIRDTAARAWCDWEDAIVAAETGGVPNSRYAEPDFRLGFARLVTHYFGHSGFLPEGMLMAEAAQNGDIPTTLIHGQLDISSPPETAFAVHKAWPGSCLRIVETGGHNASGKAMKDEITRAARLLGERLVRPS